MPLPTALCLALAAGLLAALAGRREVRIAPQHPLLTRSFAAYALFAGLVLVPVSAYFYLFHGDWFLLYLVDVRSVPSALALVGFVLEAAVGAGAFAAGAALVRSHHDAAAGAALALSLAGAAGVTWGLRDRLASVGTFAQFHGGFGLARFDEGPMLEGAVLMNAVLVVGLVFLGVRLALAPHRGQ